MAVTQAGSVYRLSTVKLGIYSWLQKNRQTEQEEDTAGHTKGRSLEG